MARVGAQLGVFLTGLCVLSACTPPRAPGDVGFEKTSESQDAVVYGMDDRLDVYESPQQWADLARQATVALMSPSDFTIGPQGPQLAPAASLQDTLGLCDSERFLDQPTNGDCSGTLIDDDLVLTAGHCVTSQNQCNNTIFVFDYLYDGPGMLAPISLDDLYGCQTLVLTTNFGNQDWAIVQLDRDATPTHAPATVSTTARGNLLTGDSVNMLGFPSGIPLKVDQGGQVREPDPTGGLDFFFASTDSFGGNSGSGVFDDDQNLIGVLTFGEADYVPSPQGCLVVNVLGENGPEQGEGVMYAQNAIDELCDDLDWPSDRLCGGTPPTCDTCNVNVPCAGDQTCLIYPTSQGVCTQACFDNIDCPMGWGCNPNTGLCAPPVEAQCDGGNLIDYDACGVPVQVVEQCLNGCQNNACISGTDGNTCDDAVVIDTGVTVNVINDNLFDTTNNYGGSCGGNGPERVYLLDIDDPVNLLAEAGGFDTLLHLRSDCDNANAELVCDDDGGPGTESRFDIDLMPGTYYLFMDAWGQNVGNYNLSLTFTSLMCPPPCPAGDRICSDDDSFQECVVDAQGCLVYGQPQLCPQGSCDDGICVADCVDECPAIGDGCFDVESVAVVGECDQWDADPCLDLLILDVCTDDEVCEDSQCVGGGCDDCEVGERRCNPLNPLTDTQRCDFNPDVGCNTWFLDDTCPMDEFCDQGLCTDNCVNDCGPGDFYCTENGGVAQCEFQANGCYEYVEYGCENGCEIGQGCVGSDGGVICPPPPCAAGESQCAGDTNVQTCIYDANGCLEWQVFACGAQTACVDGVCEQQCEGECILGDTRCTDEGQIEVCDLGGACTVWTAPMDCPGQGVCAGDSCLGECNSVCTVGDRVCVTEHAYRSCVDLGGCAVWGSPRYCFGDDVCSEGGCVTPEPTLDAGTDPFDFDGGFDKRKPDRVRVATPGCSQSLGTTPFALALGLVALARRRRRRARA